MIHSNRIVDDILLGSAKAKKGDTMNRIKTVYLDCDGVLAAFTEHALSLFDREDLIAGQEPGVYEINKVLGISQEDFWKAVDCDLFWRSIPVYKGAYSFVEELVRICSKHGVDVFHCTAGTRSDHFAKARTDWLKEFNKQAEVDIPIILLPTGMDKILLANPTTLFIDDFDGAICQVKSQEARVVLVPRIWNCGHQRACTPTDYDSILSEVRGVLERNELLEDVPVSGDTEPDRCGCRTTGVCDCETPAVPAPHVYDSVCADSGATGGQDNDLEEPVLMGTSAKRPALICHKCKALIYSRARHDMRWCPCKSVAIDGGSDYVRCAATPDALFDQISDYDTGHTEKQLYADWNKRMDKLGIVQDYIWKTNNGGGK